MIPPIPNTSGSSLGVVLVVDDQIKNIQIVGTILTQEGYEVIPATSGVQAMQRISARLPDVVLLDVVMPEMDGFEVCQRLRERPDTAHLPIIFVSAANDAETIVRGLEAGGVDYITKPFNKAELLARVRTHVALQHARAMTSQFLAEKEHLVNMVAHDLKNPLGAIRFSAQTLPDLPAEKVQALTAHIVQTCDNMLQFIDRFLSARAHERETDRLNWVRIEGHHLLDMLESWRPAAKRKNMTLTIESSPREQPLSAYGDLMVVRQILDNLLSNAIKFSPLGSTIVARIEAEEDALVVVIEDEGPGLSEQDLTHLFENYRRLSAQPTGGESSTGLGLSIAKRAADRLGAQLTLENRQSTVGTRVRLKLAVSTPG